MSSRAARHIFPLRFGIVASLVFSGDVVKWLSFGEGAGFVLLVVGYRMSS